MTDVTWASALKKIRPFVFRIFTPGGSGTGFQIANSEKTGMCGVATALHVVSHSDDWGEPIKIMHYDSRKTVLLQEADRSIDTNVGMDLAFILFPNEDLPLKKEQLDMIPSEKRLTQGSPIGWCGFPALAPNELCFFTGHVSAFSDEERSYLIDGVAINGVSGGPAFHLGSSGPIICGVLSAYIPNRVTGESLPGLCVIRDVTPYREILQDTKAEGVL